MKLGFNLFAAQARSSKMPDYPPPSRDGCGGPDDTTDPDFGRGRDNSGGPDDTSDPDFGGGRYDGGGFSGPDGSYGGYDEYH